MHRLQHGNTAGMIHNLACVYIRNFIAISGYTRVIIVHFTIMEWEVMFHFEAVHFTIMEWEIIFHFGAT